MSQRGGAGLGQNKYKSLVFRAVLSPLWSGRISLGIEAIKTGKLILYQISQRDLQIYRARLKLKDNSQTFVLFYKINLVIKLIGTEPTFLIWYEGDKARKQYSSCWHSMNTSKWNPFIKNSAQLIVRLVTKSWLGLWPTCLKYFPLCHSWVV